MIEESSTWYLGTVADGQNYRLAKYKDVNMSSLTSTTTTAKVGLLRLGELMSGQFDRHTVKGGTSSTGLTTNYWTLTPGDAHFVWQIYGYGSSYSGALTIESAIKPSLNLKSNVIITSGVGTKQNPFTLELVS